MKHLNRLVMLCSIIQIGLPVLFDTAIASEEQWEAALVDSDLPAWQMLHFNTEEVDMFADPDGDTLSNLAEFMMGTDPNAEDLTFTDSDGDGLADSWETKEYGNLNYTGSDDPEGDGITLAVEYQDILDYVYTSEIVYIEGDLASEKYRAQSIYSRGDTAVLADAEVTFTKVSNVVLNPGFSVNHGGTLRVTSLGGGPITTDAPVHPTDLQFFYPKTEDAIGVDWMHSKDIDVEGYNIYRDGNKINSTLIPGTAYKDYEPVHNETYNYQVSAVDRSGKEGEKSNPVQVRADFIPPNLIGKFPQSSANISTNGEPFTLFAVFADEGTGVASITVKEGDEDITYQALVHSNTVELKYVNPESRGYELTVTAMDYGGNELEVPFSFNLDSTPLITSASVSGGKYSEPVSITLTSSKPATIYYSIDGYPPVAATSASGESIISDIVITETTSLQFYAVDENGYMEPIKNIIYIFETPTIETTGLTAEYVESWEQVSLSWEAVTSGLIQGYKLYRCQNDVECGVLEQSREGKYPPSDRFEITTGLLTDTTYLDSLVTVGAEYKYGVLAIDSDGNPGLLSPLVSTTITSDSKASDAQEAVERATAWLLAEQNNQGYWGAKEELRILNTSQVLNALRSQQENSPASLYKAMFYLRGHHADNNDYLARKSDTLARFGQNIDQFIIRLLGQADVNNEVVDGWGVEKRYEYNAVDTSLALLATLRAPQDLIDEDLINSNIVSNLLNSTSIRSIDGEGHYGWVSGGETSYFVTALTHYALEQATGSSALDRQWVYTNQKSNGSFDSTIADTAAVLLWLSPPESEKNKAINYLILSQKTDGSWGYDTYLTGLCLEALLYCLSQ